MPLGTVLAELLPDGAVVVVVAFAGDEAVTFGAFFGVGVVVAA